MKLSEALKVARKAKKISQRELGRRIGKTGQYISYLEKEENSNPSFDTLLKISDVLSVSISDLIGVDHPSAADYEKQFEKMLNGFGITSKMLEEEALTKRDDYNNKIREILKSNGLSENEFLDGLVGAGDLIKDIASKNVDVASLLSSIEMIIKYAGVKYDENSEMYLLLKVLNDNAFPVLLDTLLEKNRINK